MKFWKLAYDMKWVDAEQLKGAVKTKELPNGEITIEEYKTITGIEFIAQ